MGPPTTAKTVLCGRSAGRTWSTQPAKDFGTETIAQPGPVLWIPYEEHRDGAADASPDPPASPASTRPISRSARVMTCADRVLLADPELLDRGAVHPRRRRRPQRTIDTSKQ